MSLVLFVIVAFWSGPFNSISVLGLQYNTTWTTYHGWQVNTPSEQTIARTARECATECSKRQIAYSGCNSATFSTTTKICLLSNETSADMTDMADPTLKTVAVPAPAPDITYQGTEFYTAFLNNLVVGTLELYFVSSVVANVNVQIPFLVIDEIFTVLGAVHKSYSTTILISVDNTEGVNGIYINSDVPITVYKSNNCTTSLDMGIVLPTIGIGKSYLIQTIGEVDDMFMIVSTQDNTNVDVTVGGVLTSYILPRLGVLFRKTSGITGTVITASADVTVMSGNECANIPVGRAACDQIWEPVAPEESSGTNFIVANMYPRGEHTVGIISTANDNIVDIYDPAGNPMASVVLNRGGGITYEYLNNETISIVATSPIQVVQYSHGGVGMLPYGDPAVMAIPPVDKFGNTYELFVPAGPVQLNVLGLTTDDETLIRLNGGVPTFEYAASVASPFGSYRVAHVNLTPGMVYTITHVNNVKFAAYMYGGQRDGEFSMSLGWNKI